MQKQRFLIFISKTICRMKKFQIRKRCTMTRRAITYFLFRIFMHIDFLLIIGKVLSSSSVATPYSIRELNRQLAQSLTHAIFLTGILYYVPRCTMRVIARRATMLAGDRIRDESEARSVLRDISRLVPAILILSILCSSSGFQ